MASANKILQPIIKLAAWAEEVGGQEGPAPPPSNTSGGHPCYWPLLENAKSASNLTTHLGHD